MRRAGCERETWGIEEDDGGLGRRDTVRFLRAGSYTHGLV
jgi:hypothetical protein